MGAGPRHTPEALHLGDEVADALAAGRGAGENEFAIVAGHPDESILLYRMGSAVPGIAMPELGKASVDNEGVAVVRRWIAEMPR